MILKYIKKPIPVEAVQWTGYNISEVFGFCPDIQISNGMLVIPALKGDYIASINDFIIKGVRGEYYPCKEERFKETYELAR